MSDRKIIKSDYYYIKPAANHILTIGKGIIKDAYTAILELVKNAYDADAEMVNINIISRNKRTIIIVSDNGHGMDFDTIINKWMVPSTADKLRQKKSKYKKRPLQGRKGIGRYAASILGDDLILKTTDTESLLTTELKINWKDFESDQKYLEDIKLLIENYQEVSPTQGTELKVFSESKWSDNELDELISSLKTLLSPFEKVENDFKIHLKIEIEESEKYKSFSDFIYPFPILDYFHYRISGKVAQFLINGERKVKAELTIENRHLKNIIPQKTEKEIIFRNDEKPCGKVNLDIRAYDLDELDELKINESLDGEEVKNIIRKQLPGIAVIRENFRVRPYGDKKNDWLGLNFRRFNNPTLRLSNNQVAGYVFVEQEEYSHLEEKATREGFKENSYYEGLKTIITECLAILEDYRYKFRRQNDKGAKKKKTIEEQIQEVSNYTDLNEKINKLLTIANVEASVKTKISDVIEKEAKEKEAQFEDIRKTIAKYQGQVTLGRIMTVVLHEGRKPLNALKHHPKFIDEWSKEFIEILKKEYEFKDKNLKNLRDKILDRLNDNKQQAEIISGIFKKLEPLSSGKRLDPKEFTLSKPIKDAFKLYEYELSENGITYNIIGDTDAKVNGWELDFNMAFANLVENSIFWMEQQETKHIEVIIVEDEEKVFVDYSDTGTGIDEDNIASQNIFDPGYSTKDNGTGLGLSIAGESLQRNHARISAVASNTGANFVIEITK